MFSEYVFLENDLFVQKIREVNTFSQKNKFLYFRTLAYRKEKKYFASLLAFQ